MNLTIKTNPMTHPKTKLGKFFQSKFAKIVAPFVRGAIKIGLPIIGTPIVEAVSNLTQPKTMMATTTDGVAGAIEIVKPPKHSWVSIIVQSVLAIAVLYAFWTKAITIQNVVTIIKSIFGL